MNVFQASFCLCLFSSSWIIFWTLRSITKLFTQSLSKFCCQNSKLKTQHFFLFFLAGYHHHNKYQYQFLFLFFFLSLLSLSPSLFPVLNVQRMPGRKESPHHQNDPNIHLFFWVWIPVSGTLNETCKVKVKHKSEDERGQQTRYHFKDISITKGFFFFFSPIFVNVFE